MGDEGTSPLLNSAAPRCVQKHQGTVVTSSPAPTNNADTVMLSKAMTSDSTSVVEIWEVGKALGAKFAGQNSEVTNCLLEVELRDSRARGKPKMKTTMGTEELKTCLLVLLLILVCVDDYNDRSCPDSAPQCLHQSPSLSTGNEDDLKGYC
ncbi:hypothetical protein Ancab_023087 [Ancistrocladus abbreviatus]